MAGPPSVLRRRQGEGWLILAGSIPEFGGQTADLMDRLLGHLDLSRAVAALTAPDTEVGEIQELLEAVEEWLGTEASVLELDTDLEEEGWDESGLLFLIGEDPAFWLDALRGEAGDRLSGALARGTVIFAMGGVAAAFGEEAVSLSDPGQRMAGLRWLPSILVACGPEAAQGEAALDWLRQTEPHAVVHLEPGSILALGPDGEVERWSEIPPEIVLGSGWRRA